MAAWTDDDLDRIGNSEELALASRRADGSLSGFVTIGLGHTPRSKES
jgi:hypothetical protein